MQVASRSYPPPPKKKGKAPVEDVQGPVEFCDKCHIAYAKFEITHEKHSPLYLCGHHYRMHSFHFLIHHYTVKEI